MAMPLRLRWIGRPATASRRGRRRLRLPTIKSACGCAASGTPPTNRGLGRLNLRRRVTSQRGNSDRRHSGGESSGTAGMGTPLGLPRRRQAVRPPSSTSGSSRRCDLDSIGDRISARTSRGIRPRPTTITCVRVWVKAAANSAGSGRGIGRDGLRDDGHPGLHHPRRRRPLSRSRRTERHRRRWATPLGLPQRRRAVRRPSSTSGSSRMGRLGLHSATGLQARTSRGIRM